jgi:16S rRNA (cytosine1402-N4)-methyltransferase
VSADPVFVHTSVLAAEVMDYLNPRPGGVYVDGTAGGGGHTDLIARAAGPAGRVIALDRDRAALTAARNRLANHAGVVTFVHERFSRLGPVLAELGLPAVDGIVLDLGVSSPQLDLAERGFSFTHKGPLDMRMDRDRGETALELLRRVDRDQLAAILRDYGEERYSRRIADRIKEQLHGGQLTTTADLAELVRAAIPARAQRTSKVHPATRTFQAVRIAVNRELDELATFLAEFPAYLRPGGRCVIIAFHSLEDRLVKQRFRDLEWTSRLPADLAAAAGEPTAPVCRRLTRKPVGPGAAELDRNPRARSARLRACEKGAQA